MDELIRLKMKGETDENAKLEYENKFLRMQLKVSYVITSILTSILTTIILVKTLG